MHDLVRQQRLDRLPQQPLLLEPAHLVSRRQREREPGDDRVEERHAGLERPGHRGPVGLHEQVVDEVAAEVDVLQAGQQLEALGLGEPRPGQRQRIEPWRRPGQLGPRVGGEDLLPALVPLERRQVRGAHEALRR